MRWTLRPHPDPETTASLAKELSVDPIIARLLVSRGINTFEKARTYFRPSYTDLQDPYLMKVMDLAV